MALKSRKEILNEAANAEGADNEAILMAALNTGLNAALRLMDWERILRWCRRIPFETERLCLDKAVIIGVTEGLWETKGKNLVGSGLSRSFSG